MLVERAEDAVGRRRLAGVLDAVGVGVLHFVLAGGGVAAGDLLDEAAAFDAGGPGAVEAHAPEGDVVVVGPPVGDGAAGVVVPEAEGDVAALGDVLDQGGLAEPHVPVERLGRFLGGERAVAQAGGDDGRDRL